MIRTASQVESPLYEPIFLFNCEKNPRSVTLLATQRLPFRGEVFVRSVGEQFGKMIFPTLNGRCCHLPSQIKTLRYNWDSKLPPLCLATWAVLR